MTVKQKLLCGLISFLIVAILAIPVSSTFVSADPATEIWDWNDLHDIRNNLGGSYVLMNDLDSTTDGYAHLAGPAADGGAGWQPIGTFADRFTGSFDGQGYEIRDLFIDRPGQNHVGVFGAVDSGGVVESVGMVNAEVTGDWYAGGLVGGNWGTVTNSYSTGDVEASRRAGGLIGLNSGTVSNSYSRASAAAAWYAGGLVAENSGSVSNSYSTGSVTGTLEVGGLVGGGPGTVTNSFWDVETSGRTTSAGGDGKTTAEMQDMATFVDAGWDIDTTSLADPTGGYPFLAWQLGGSPTWYMYVEPAVEPTVTTAEATDVTTDSATLNMEFTVGDYSPVEVRFSWRESGTAPWVETTWTSKAADGTHAETLTGLDSDTTYEFKAQLGYDNTVIDGTVLTFTTEDEILTVCVATATGTGTACFTPSHGTIANLEALTVPADPPEDYAFPHGMFSFQVVGLIPGETVTLTIQLPTAVPTGTKWWKYHAGQWHDYNVPITISGNTITITLTDGGIGDIDGIADGIITDPGGPGYPLLPPVVVGWQGYPVNKLAVMAPWIALFAGIIAGAGVLMLRRRRA